MARELRRLAAIVSTDVVAYSRLMGRDESGTLARLKSHLRELVDPKISEYGGRTVKSMGDGLLLEFPSVVDAVRCAVDVQRGMGERNVGTPDEEQIRFRVGINVGDIIIDGDDIFGDGVNVAARLQALADPGGICVSRAVRDQVLDKLDFAFVALGSHDVKNIVRPLEVYGVQLDSQGATQAVRRPGDRMARSVWRPSRRVWLAMGTLAVIGVSVAAWTTNQYIPRPVAVTPYSIQDRRMTFAVLPFQAPTDDPTGTRVAKAMTEAAFAAHEQFTEWAQIVSATRAEQASARHASIRDIASDLHVHFLLRGKVTSAASGYALSLLLVDGATERVIASRTMAVGVGPIASRPPDALVIAIFGLIQKALEIEVERTRGKPLDALDVRDLTFRAFVDWRRLRERNDESGAYKSAMDLLQRAFAISPNDPLALSITAHVSLCECVNEWSRNVDEQLAIGTAALEKYLQHDPQSRVMLRLKGHLYGLRGRYEESLLIADSILKRDPNYTPALVDRAHYLLRLGKPRDALIAISDARNRREAWPDLALAAAIHYALADYVQAGDSAQAAKTQMSPKALGDNRGGAVGLILVAAEARLGNLPRAHAALADFKAAVPGVDTISAIKQWMHPDASLAGFAPFFDGLRLAGIPD